jgi:hypothetical protein
MSSLRYLLAARRFIMAFRYGCFISYRVHQQSQIAGRFIHDLSTALRNELTLLMDEDIYVDQERLKGGTFYNPAIASALCGSVCMIVIYTPTYFSREHMYCAREFHAMERLEQTRLAKLAGQAGREAGLIIPVILRGLDTVPAVIRAQRHCYTFDRFHLSTEELARNSQFEERIQELATVIQARRHALLPWADELTCDCQSFALPTEDEVRPWLDRVVPPMAPFPYR